jgi:glycosyltransferase involved in cell wall biosynthesis
MISICIPVYNCRVGDLVKKLSGQAELLNVPSEIIIIDDFSDGSIREQNESICKKGIYVLLEKNIGRAAIRNSFLLYSKYDYLLFLDCDSVISSDDFLSRYIDTIKKHPDSITYGGREYQKLAPERSYMLRWKYGRSKESKSCEVRKKDPYKSFMTNNFVISRKIFETIQFDERLVEYGHEDTLFGYELRKRNISIIHLDNPVLNGYLENNSEFIEKTEKAISNLAYILEFTNFDKNLIESITLLRTFYRLYKVRGIIQIIFIILRPVIKYFLSRGFVNLYLFDFYKLGTLAMTLSARKPAE